MKRKYQTAYSTRSLMMKEFSAVLNSVIDFEAFINGKEEVNTSVIPANSERTKSIVLTEIKKRINCLSKSEFLELFVNGCAKDKALILFYAVCKTYPLIPDFIIDTVLPKWYNLDFELDSHDFKTFIYKISESYPEFNEFSEKNLSNISGATIKIINEVGLRVNSKIVKGDYNPLILREIISNGDSWFLEVLLLNAIERQEIIGQ